MKQITLKVPESKYALLLQFLKSITYVEIETAEVQAIKNAPKLPDERQQMIDFIMNYQNDKPSFGDAAEWQSSERSDRELPFQR